MKYISIICPTYNEEKYISNCIVSILESDYPKEKMEVFFMDGGSVDKTAEIINSYSKEFPFIQLIYNPQKTVPFAMNKGITASKGDVIIRLDAHSFYPKNYFSSLVNYLQILKADNVGCSCKTDVININKKTMAIKEVLSNKFGVGNSIFRIGNSEIRETDTVPFGCFRRDVFERFGLYNEKLVRNQDIELNKRIKKSGGKIYLISDIYCTYYARETFIQIMKNNYQNGFWNIMTLYYTKSLNSLSIRHLVPFLFITSLILPILISLMWFQFILISLLSILAYTLLLIYITHQISAKKKIPIIMLLRAFTALHFSYGFGSLIAFIVLPFKKTDN